MLRSFAALEKTFEQVRECVAELRLALEAQRSAEQGRGAEPDLQTAAEILCSLRVKVARRRALSRKRRCDVGRQVVVLWVPASFPEEQRPELADLVPYRGVVVKHSRVRKEATHYVRYDDGQCRWHKKDKLFKFLT